MKRNIATFTFMLAIEFGYHNVSDGVQQLIFIKPQLIKTDCMTEAGGKVMTDVEAFDHKPKKWTN